MIGIDTNILLRIFETEDDPAQSLRARAAIEEHAPVYLHDVVLAEFVWTCRSKFKQSRQRFIGGCGRSPSRRSLLWLAARFSNARSKPMDRGNRISPIGSSASRMSIAGSN